jgi:hypothetical protein
LIFAVAAQRTREYFSPPGSFSLWLMPPTVEHALDETMIRWAHEGRSWPEVPVLLDSLKKEGLSQTLKRAGVLTDGALDIVSKLKLGPEEKSVRLSPVVRLTDETVAVLTGGFVHSKPEKLLLPTVSVTAVDGA